MAILCFTGKRYSWAKFLKRLDQNQRQRFARQRTSPDTEMKPEDRIDSFDEIVDGFTMEMAVEEASRCVDWFMKMLCPLCMLRIIFVRFMKEIWSKRLNGCMKLIHFHMFVEGLYAYL